MDHSYLQRAGPDRVAEVLDALVLQNLADHIHRRLFKSFKPVLVAHLPGCCLLLLVPTKVGA